MDWKEKILISNIRPLPAIEKVQSWSKYANIHLLSNHRIEWIKSILKPIEPYICSVTVSCEVGYCKPKPEIYGLVHEQLNNHRDILFVDDQSKNLKEAISLGWKTILADVNGDWIYNLTSLLSTTEA